MSRLVRCEDVVVGTRLRYVGRPCNVVQIFEANADTPKSAMLKPDRGYPFVLELRDGWTLWEMEGQ